MSADGDNDRVDAGNRRDEKVGYGRPPKHTRFQKGQSGNPRGRPRQTQNHKCIAHRVAAELHEVRVGEAPVKLPTVALLMETIRGEMLKGKPRAVKLFERLSEKYAARHETPKGGWLVVPGRMTEEQWQRMIGAPQPELATEE